MKIRLPSFRKEPASAAPAAAAPAPAPVPDAGPSGLGDRMRLISRKLRGATGWVFLFLAVFVAVAWLSLPTRGIAWRIGQEARKAGFMIDIEDLSVWPWGSATLRNVTWTYAPSHPGQIPQQLVLDAVHVDFSVLKFLLFRDIDVAIDTQIDEAPIHAEYARSSDESSVKVEISELPLMDVPKLQQALGAPLRGSFGLSVDLTMPENQFAKAEGSISISCAACSLGDGESLLFIPGSSGLTAKGMTVPEIDLGSLTGTLKVKAGKATAEEFGTKSADVELAIWGDMSLKDPFTKSEFGLNLKLLVTKALQEKSETIRFAVQTAGNSSKMEGPDEGWLGFKLRGTVGKPRFMGIKAKTAEERMLEKRQKNAEKEAKRSREKAKKDAAKASREKASEAVEAKAEDPSKPLEPLGLQPGTPETEADIVVKPIDTSAPSTAPPSVVLPSVPSSVPSSVPPSGAPPEEPKPEEEPKPAEEPQKPEEPAPAPPEGGDGQGQGGEGGEAPQPPAEAPSN